MKSFRILKRLIAAVDLNKQTAETIVVFFVLKNIISNQNYFTGLKIDLLKISLAERTSAIEIRKNANIMTEVETNIQKTYTIGIGDMR